MLGDDPPLDLTGAAVRGRTEGVAKGPFGFPLRRCFWITLSANAVGSHQVDEIG